MTSTYKIELELELENYIDKKCPPPPSLSVVPQSLLENYKIWVTSDEARNQGEGWVRNHVASLKLGMEIVVVRVGIN